MTQLNRRSRPPARSHVANPKSVAGRRVARGDRDDTGAATQGGVMRRKKMYLTYVDECMDKIRKACSREPMDWDAIRREAATLGARAATTAERTAVQRLLNASDHHCVLVDTVAVEKAFLEGKPDLDGYPRRF